MKPLIPNPELDTPTVPPAIVARWRKAEQLWENGDIQTAADTLAASPTWPECPAMLAFAGKVFLKANPKTAEDFFEELIFRNPLDADSHRSLAELCRRDDRESEADEHEQLASAIRSKRIFAPPTATTPAVTNILTKHRRISKLKSIALAGALHLLIILTLALWMISGRDAPQLMGVTVAPEEAYPVPQQDSRLVQALQQRPRRLTSEKPEPIAAHTPAPIFIPDTGTPDFDDGSLPAFAAAIAKTETGNESSGKSGTVEFFGHRTVAKRVVFIVDFSASMKKGQRLQRLKNELSNALASMPDGMLYNIIYYADHAWVGMTTHGYPHTSAPERIQWRTVSNAARDMTRREIRSMAALGSTFWGPPMRLAMTLDPKPDLIWLMSDGDAADRESIVRAINRIVGEDIRVNTIGMELGGRPFISLVDIADKTGGDYSLIMHGVQHHGEEALRFTNDVYGLRTD